MATGILAKTVEASRFLQILVDFYAQFRGKFVQKPRTEIVLFGPF